jgi:hypothetical protein
MKEVTSSRLYPGAMIPMQPVSLTTKLGPVMYLTRNLCTVGSGTAEVGVNHLSEGLVADSVVFTWAEFLMLAA